MAKSGKEAQIISQFDYNGLTDEQRSIVLQRTGEIRERLAQSAQSIWEIGQRLVDVRSQLKYGQFNAWLKAEFGWSNRTAYSFINVYETFRDRANLAEVNIATSALYLLAAPSTPSDVREQVIEQAKSGQRVTHKELVKQLQHSKAQSKDLKPAELETGSKLEIISLIPQHSISEEVVTVDTIATVAEPQTIQKPDWFLLGQQHYLFDGDTALPEFVDNLPDVALAIAVTLEDWDHDWLIDSVKTLIVLQPSTLESEMIEKLITMFTKPGEVVVFPWLPQADMIAIAHRLGRTVYAGDASAKCRRLAVQTLGLSVEPVEH
jgi:hypothetical protein